MKNIGHGWVGKYVQNGQSSDILYERSLSKLLIMNFVKYILNQQHHKYFWWLSYLSALLPYRKGAAPAPEAAK